MFDVLSTSLVILSLVGCDDQIDFEQKRIHESSHAIIAFYNDVQVLEISTVNDTGYIVYDNISGNLWNDALIVIAGCEGAKIIGGYHYPSGCWSDDGVFNSISQNIIDQDSTQTKESIKDFCVKKVNSILKSKQSQVWSLVEILENNQDHLDSLQIVSVFNNFED